MDSPIEKTEDRNFTAADIGPLENLNRYAYKHPILRKAAPGKLFLKDLLGLTGMEVSMNRFAAGARMPVAHRHRKNEELYIFIRGRGQFQVDGRVIEVREGTVLRVAPEGARAWRNHSEEDLYYICVQVTAGSGLAPEIADAENIRKLVRWPTPSPPSNEKNR